MTHQELIDNLRYAAANREWQDAADYATQLASDPNLPVDELGRYAQLAQIYLAQVQAKQATRQADYTAEIFRIVDATHIATGAIAQGVQQLSAVSLSQSHF